VLARPFKVGFSDSMDLIFLLAAGVVVLAFLLLLFLPQIPLRTQSASAARENPTPAPDAEPAPVSASHAEPVEPDILRPTKLAG